jgi:flagellar basal body-associated protein FliL
MNRGTRSKEPRWMLWFMIVLGLVACAVAVFVISMWFHLNRLGPMGP